MEDFMTGHIFCDDKNVWKLTIKICHYKNIEFDNDNVLYILEDFCNDKHVWNLMPQHFLGCVMLWKHACLFSLKHDQFQTRKKAILVDDFEGLYYP
jgi:hypothetical protein